MIPDLEEYQVLEKINQGKYAMICKGVRKSDYRKVIIKIANGQSLANYLAALQQNELQIAKRLVEKKYIAHLIDSENDDDVPVLIYEDFDAVLLSNLMEKAPFDFKRLLDLSIKLACSIRSLHKENIVHHNIAPENFLISQDLSKVWITGLGLATYLFPGETLSKTYFDLKKESKIRDLAYVSPEEMGKTNRFIDYRSDYYSFGIILYELATGQKPFLENHLDMLVYAHVAKEVTSPCEINNKISKAFSNIVLKLLEKKPEDRYQSIDEVIYDLQRCLKDISNTDLESQVVSSDKNVSSIFYPPQKLYGRGEEMNRLKELLKKVCKGSSHVAMISGQAGIGKTALVKELQADVLKTNGFFIQGSYERKNLTTPYLGIIQALNDLVNQVLCMPQEKIDDFKEKILNHLGQNGQVIIDVVPNLEKIIGKQPVVPKLAVREEQNRFLYFFQSFISVFSETGSPLVFFLDNLQWVDKDSIKLIELLLEKANDKAIFLIGSFREEEVKENHPLLSLFDALFKKELEVSKVRLEKLQLKDVSNLLKDTFKFNQLEANHLATVIFERTYGNPFFIYQLIIYLVKNHYITYSDRWGYDLEKIEKNETFLDVQRLLLKKIEDLKPETLAFLKVLSLMESELSVDFKFFKRLLGFDTMQMIASIEEALQEAVIVSTLNLNSHFIELNQTTVHFKSFTFAHHRIQKTVGSLLTKDEKQHFYCKIVERMLKERSFKDHEKDIFIIISLFDCCSEYQLEHQKSKDFAYICLTAGKKAYKFLAYHSAIKCLKKGIFFLGDKGFDIDYKTYFSLNHYLGKCLLLTKRTQEAQQVFDLLRQTSQNPLEQAKVYESQVQIYISQGDYKQAIDVGIKALHILGEPVTLSYSKLQILTNLINIKYQLRNKKVDVLLSLPKLSNPKDIMIIDLIVSMLTSAYLIDKEIFALIVLKGLVFMMKKGITSNASILFASYGILLAIARNDFEQAYHLGRVGSFLAKRAQNRISLPMVSFLHGTFLNSRRNHLRTSIPIFQEGYEEGVRLGDMINASYCIGYLAIARLIIGEKLDFIRQEARKFFLFSRKVKAYHKGYPFLAISQYVAALKGETKSFTSLDSNVFDEAQFFKDLEKHNIIVTLQFTYLYKLMLFVIFEKYEEALDLYEEMEKKVSCLQGQPMEVEKYYYHSLALMGRYPFVSKEEKKKFLKILRKNQKKLKKWAQATPQNYLHKYCLTEAEFSKILGKKAKALEFYDQAIESARENGFIQNEALANERIGKFYFEKGKTYLATRYLKTAQKGYFKWGASAKVDDMAAKYPHLLDKKAAILANNNVLKNIRHGLKKMRSTASALHDALDLSSVLKSSQMLAGQIDIKNLLNELLKIVIENAGAEKAILLLLKKGQLFVEGEKWVNKEETKVLQSIPVYEKSKDLCVTVVKYVERVQKAVVLSEAYKEGDFVNDPYIEKNKVKSLLCFPLTHKDKLTGILYLENNLTIKAFTPDRVEVLKLLAEQISSSIESAILYSNLKKLLEKLKQSNIELEDYSRNLEDKVFERTKELDEKNVKLQKHIQEISKMQKELVRKEKLASLGILTKGIAQELSFPLKEVVKVAEKSTKELEQVLEKVDLRQCDNLLDKLVDDIRKVQENGKKAESIVSSIVGHSRVGERVLQKFNIHQLLKENISRVINKYKSENPEVSIQVVDEFDASVQEIDITPKDIAQALYNLIDNACIALIKKKKKLGDVFFPKLIVRTKNDDQNLMIEIEDNGLGISEKLKKNLFKPFNTDKSSDKGLGLGMSIAHDIITEGHKGTIEAKTKEGEWTKILISLPINQYNQTKKISSYADRT